MVVSQAGKGEGLRQAADRLRPATADEPQLVAPRTVSRGGKVYTTDTRQIGRQVATPADPQATPAALMRKPSASEEIVSALQATLAARGTGPIPN